MSNENSQELKKIVYVGLDNSGKTSIILSLQKDTNIMSFCSLKPTQGLDIAKFRGEDQQFTIWELGGQKVYRENYLKGLDKYIENADQIIFVIDIQDTSRYELALQYLENVVKQLRNKKLEFSVYLHKFDPGLEKIKKFSTERISSVLINRINTIVPPELNCKIFKTSVYAIFQKSQFQ